MANDVEISFVDESNFKKQENRYFWSKTSEWELHSTISLDSNDSLAGTPDFGEELESTGDISSHDDTCSDSDTDSNYVLEPSTSAGSRRGKKSSIFNSLPRVPPLLTLVELTYPSQRTQCVFQKRIT